jgi:hypothetical protein
MFAFLLRFGLKNSSAGSEIRRQYSADFGRRVINLLDTLYTDIYHKTF